MSPTDSKPVRCVCAHGFGGSGADFDVLKTQVGGLGLATPTLAAPDFRIPGVTDRSVLLGYSMGGRLALQQTIGSRPKPAGLVLVSATAGLEGEAARAARRAADARLAARIQADGAAQFEAWWSQQPLIRTQNAMPEPFRSQLRARRAQNDPDALIAALERVGQGAFPACWHRLEQLRLPVLVVSGGRDAKYSALGERLAAGLPNARHIVMDKCGHAPHLEAPAGFARHLVAFVRSLG